MESLFPIYLRNNKVLYKWKIPKVIQFVNYKYKLDPENYCREQLLLYTSWRSEHTDLYHGKKTYPEAFATKRHDIESKMRVCEPMAEELTNAIEIFKQDSLDFDDVAPSTQHEEFDHQLK